MNPSTVNSTQMGKDTHSVVAETARDTLSILAETARDTLDAFSRSSVSANKNVQIFDTDEETGLTLYSYLKCDNTSDEFTKQCRGLIYQDDKLVMKAFPYTNEYTLDDPTFQDHKLCHESPSSWKFYNSQEGALLRLFHFSGKWFLSTNRKLNAFRSKWSSKDSFGTLFKRALENEVSRPGSTLTLEPNTDGNILDQFYATLDKNIQYMFLLRNNSDNRIVCSAPKPNEPLLYHVGSYSTEVSPPALLNQEICIPKPLELEFKDFHDLTTYVSNVNPYITQGIVCVNEKTNEYIKILHKDYQAMFKVRGNEPSVKFRYLQVRMSRYPTETLYKLYPEMAKEFDDYESIIYDIANNIYKTYVQRYIHKMVLTIPHEEYQTMRDCHSWYLSDREKNRISLHRVINILNKQSPTNINRMIKHVKIEQTNKTRPPRQYKNSTGSTTASPAFVNYSGPKASSGPGDIKL